MHSVFIAIVRYISTNRLFNSAEDNKQLLVGTSERVARGKPNGYNTWQILPQSQGLLSTTVDLNPLV